MQNAVLKPKNVNYKLFWVKLEMLKADGVYAFYVDLEWLLFNYVCAAVEISFYFSIYDIWKSSINWHIDIFIETQM